MTLWKSPLNLMSRKNRRRSHRISAPPLAVYFWTGAAPEGQRARDISQGGLFLMTSERWYPGTMFMLVLQETNMVGDQAPKSLTVQAKVVRWGSDGVGMEFVLPESNHGSASHAVFEYAADPKAFKPFFKNLELIDRRKEADQIEMTDRARDKPPD